MTFKGFRPDFEIMKDRFGKGSGSKYDKPKDAPKDKQNDNQGKEEN